MQKEDLCPLCNQLGKIKVKDTQEHLSFCKELSSPGEFGEDGVKYSDIFSDNKIKQANVTKLLEARYKKKKMELEKMDLE